MNRLILVGMHNKPHKVPLCSSTFSGKLVDRIIKQIKIDVLKTNLYDVDYYPLNEDEKQALAYDWIDRIDPKINDIVVLLGAEVHENFPDCDCIKLKIAHPASNRSHEDMNTYVSKTVEKINKIIKDARI